MTGLTYAAQVMLRDDACYRCGRRDGPVNAHHRLFASHGGPDTLDNRIRLCGEGNLLRGPEGQEWCHGWCHQNGHEAAESGWVISQYDKRPPGEITVWCQQKGGMVYLTPGGEVIREEAVVAWLVPARLPLTEGDVAGIFGARGETGG